MAASSTRARWIWQEFVYKKTNVGDSGKGENYVQTSLSNKQVLPL